MRAVKKSSFFNLGKALAMKIVLENYQTPSELIILTIFLRSSVLKRTSKQTRGHRELLFSVSTNYIDQLFSLRGELWNISIPSRRIQKNSDS